MTSRTKGISAVVGFLVPFFGLFFRKKLGRLVGQFAGGDHVVITSALASATSSLRTTLENTLDKTKVIKLVW